MISEEGLKEFKQIILEEQGVELTDEKAYQDATAFLEAFKLLVTDTSLIQKSLVATKKEDVIKCYSVS